MKYFKWEPGRQGSGYFKMLLFQTSFMDLYLLKFPEKSYINPHKDPLVILKEHHRLNITLVRALDGGQFYYRGRMKYNDEITNYIDYNRIVYFRPDIFQHGLTQVIAGTRYILSIGWINDKV